MSRGRVHIHKEDITRLWASDWSLTILLVSLVSFLFVIHPVLDALGYDPQLLGGLLFTLMLASGVAAVSRSRLMTLVLGVVAAVTVALHWVSYVTTGVPLSGIDAPAAFVATSMLAGIVLVQVFSSGPITSQRIQGAIAVYLLVALVFAAAYACIGGVLPNSFSGMTTGPNTPGHAFQRYVYFSFVTLTTVGYGDIVPLQPFARSLAIMEALIGQLFPAILLARLVSLELVDREARLHDGARRQST